VEATADAQLHLSVVTLGEIQAGIELTREQDSLKANEIEAWLDLVAQTYNVLPMDAAIFRAWARLMHKKCWHRFKIEPPCRLNFEPGLLANL